jgi:hypothetical protein
MSRPVAPDLTPRFRRLDPVGHSGPGRMVSRYAVTIRVPGWDQPRAIGFVARFHGWRPSRRGVPAGWDTWWQAWAFIPGIRPGYVKDGGNRLPVRYPTRKEAAAALVRRRPQGPKGQPS